MTTRNRTETYHVKVTVDADTNATVIEVLEALVRKGRKQEPLSGIRVVHYQVKSLTKHYTVVGIDQNTDERFAYHVWAESAEEAEQIATDSVVNPVVAGVFLGHIRAEQ